MKSHYAIYLCHNSGCRSVFLGEWNKNYGIPLLYSEDFRWRNIGSLPRYHNFKWNDGSLDLSLSCSVISDFSGVGCCFKHSRLLFS